MFWFSSDVDDISNDFNNHNDYHSCPNNDDDDDNNNCPNNDDDDDNNCHTAGKWVQFIDRAKSIVVNVYLFIYLFIYLFE